MARAGLSPDGGRRLGAASLALALSFPAARSPAAEAGAEVFALFARRCIECHGAAKQSGKLRLDSVDGIFKGGRSGPPIAAGKSAESLLYQKVTATEARKRMPPEGDPLDPREVEAIRAWIDSGAKSEALQAAKAPASEDVAPRAELLPGGFAPVFALAGERSGRRLAIARGAAVEVHEVLEPVKKDGGGEQPAAAIRLVTVLRGHTDLVSAIAWSRDGKRLATGEFRAVRLWDAETWQAAATLAPHADRVLALVFSPDGRRLAAAGGLPTESGEIKVWNLENGKEAWSATPHSDTVLGLDWTSDGKWLVTGAADRVTYVLEAESGKLVYRLEGHTHHVLAAAASPDAKLAATAGADGTVRIWDLEKGEYRRSLRGHERPVTSVAFHAEKRLASTSGDGTARFWNADSEGERFSFGEAKGYLQAGVFFADGKCYATAEQEGTVRVYDVEKRKLLATIEPGR
jgi:WD40 repeat protein